MNRWEGLGRLSADPEIKTTDSGKTVARFAIACEYKSKDKKYTEFVPCEAWEKTARIIGQYCEKGDQIFVEGRLHTNVYDKNGQKRYFTNVVVNRFEFGSKRRSDSEKKLPDPGESNVLPPLPESIWENTPPLNETNPSITAEDVPF